ncbi:MAG: DUF2752 domain-containing protein [Lachnospiraceae bacterium]
MTKEQNRKHPKDPTEETVLYIIGWCMIVLFLLYVAMNTIYKDRPSLFRLPCLMHTITGGYCPGCGGTRAVIALLHGNLWRSFRCNPIVPYAAVIGIPFMLTQTIERISRGKWKIGMKFHAWYTWAALAILLTNFLIKNIALFLFHIDLMPA